MNDVKNEMREILQDIVNDFKVEKFNRFFRRKSDQFRELNEDWSYYVASVKNDDGRFKDFQNGIALGEIEFQDHRVIICSFRVVGSLSERSGKRAQYDLAKKILKQSNYDAGIFIFHDAEGNFRFSLVYAIYLGNRRDFSNFRRFTYFVSKKRTNQTFLQRISVSDFSSLEGIKEAFSVEPVTREFYREIQNWYFWAMDKVRFPDFGNQEGSANDQQVKNATNLIRLITRIIFIWFIKEKNLVPETLFDPTKLKDIVKDFGKGSNYYNAILQNLFFATLNQKQADRAFAEEGSFHQNKTHHGVKNLYRYRDKFLISKEEVLSLFRDIPFLNGGLFDCLDKDGIYIDGFSRNPNKQAQIPDNLFFMEQGQSVNLSSHGIKGEKHDVRGLINILSSYNFTIDESTPTDQEVALDPELLGKVFENLLASYNPETATSARKATGSYYTPREIVDYMVETSLAEYLHTQHPDIGKEKIELLLSYSDELPELSEEEKKRLVRAIDEIKIIDPACGSGAFPMGILLKLVHTLQKLDPENKYWKELQTEKVSEEAKRIFTEEQDKEARQKRLDEINEAFDERINEPDYARKLYLIENCIYGVDIQPIAIQISKLRFFISLVLDQKVDPQKKNFGIKPLPNLETKFVAANTLVGLERPKQLSFRDPQIDQIEKELKELRHRYFTAKTRAEKIRYQQKDRELRERLAATLINDGWDDKIARKIADYDLYDQNLSADWSTPNGCSV